MKYLIILALYALLHPVFTAPFYSEANLGSNQAVQYKWRFYGVKDSVKYKFSYITICKSQTVWSKCNTIAPSDFGITEVEKMWVEIDLINELTGKPKLELGKVYFYDDGTIRPDVDAYRKNN